MWTKIPTIGIVISLQKVDYENSMSEL